MSIQVKTADKRQELSARVQQMMTGRSADECMNVAANLLIATFAQMYPDRARAMSSFDQVMTRVRNELLNGRYDPVSGKRRTRVLTAPAGIENLLRH